jgi:hypothetical protein
MKDVEILLRFFALRHADNYQRGMKGFLNLYMVRARTFTEEDIAYLRNLFETTMTLARQIYGDLLLQELSLVPHNVSLLNRCLIVQRLRGSSRR